MKKKDKDLERLQAVLSRWEGGAEKHTVKSEEFASLLRLVIKLTEAHNAQHGA